MLQNKENLSLVAVYVSRHVSLDNIVYCIVEQSFAPDIIGDEIRF